MCMMCYVGIALYKIYTAILHYLVVREQPLRSGFFIYNMGPADWICLVRIDSMCLFILSHLPGPNYRWYWVIHRKMLDLGWSLSFFLLFTCNFLIFFYLVFEPESYYASFDWLEMITHEDQDILELRNYSHPPASCSWLNPLKDTLPCSSFFGFIKAGW